MKLIVGAGGTTQDGWISTEESQLDILNPKDFSKLLNGLLGFENVLAEHVLEHLTNSEISIALRNVNDYMVLGGRFRIAVPDGYHPDKDYIDYVKPKDSDVGTELHKVLLNYRILSLLLEEAGFETKLLEWWDENHVFHSNPWNEIDGRVDRCLANDARNNDGKPHYTSLIVDAFKVRDKTRVHLIDAYKYVENHDVNRLSPFNRKKTSAFYELARIAPSGGAIVELGSYHGEGTVALWYGSRDGRRGNIICVDPYTEMRGWADEPYEPNDEKIFLERMFEEKVVMKLIKGYAAEVVKEWKEPIALLMYDIPFKNSMPREVPAWTEFVIKGGLIALRDIDDYSMGTAKTINNLLSTGNWGNRRYHDAFITSIEKIR